MLPGMETGLLNLFSSEIVVMQARDWGDPLVPVKNYFKKRLEEFFCAILVLK